MRTLLGIRLAAVAFAAEPKVIPLWPGAASTDDVQGLLKPAR
jgi:hypothetical protein